MKLDTINTFGRRTIWPSQSLSTVGNAVLIVFLVGFFYACGLQQSDEDMGELVITLTDAPGDFQVYNVDVISLTLHKANGAQVDTLPLTTSVDFSQYTDMTEFLTAATVPNGVYTSATMMLDYSQSILLVENENGESVAVDANNIVDEDGKRIDQLEVSVRLENRNSLTIAAGVPMHLSLDFDLSASNRVTFEGGIPYVTVEPFLAAHVNKEAVKIHRVRGGLKSVNPDDSSFKVAIRPFSHRLKDQDERFGTLNVVTGPNTNYAINDAMYTGFDGIIALNTEPHLSAIVVLGNLKFNPRRFEAREVRVGSSVPGGDKDVVSGNIVSRTVDPADTTGIVLHVQGVSLMRSDGTVVFHNTAKVRVGADTHVWRQLSADSHTIADLSIGQRVSIFGLLTESSVGELTMDATQGYVGMKLTKLLGHALDADSITYPATNLVMDLQSIDHRRIGNFDFTGTGVNEEFSADPFEYEIDTGDLELSHITTNTALKILGHVKPWAKEYSYDFTAQSVIDVSKVTASLAVSWRPATDLPFVSTDASQIVLNLTGVGKFHHVSRAGVVLDLAQAATAPIIHAPESGQGSYYLVQGDNIKMFTDFAGFVTELESLLANGIGIKGIKCRGQYDDATTSISADVVKILMRGLIRSN